MKIYRDTITHYRRNKLDDHAACGDDLLGRRNEDQLDPFNTTCRNCLISTGRHHSCFQNIVNWIQLTQVGPLVDVDWVTDVDKTPDAFHRVVQVHTTNDKVETWDVIFNNNWAIERIVFVAINSKEESK